MKLNDYRLLRSLGSGPDGIAHLAESATDPGLFEIRILNKSSAVPYAWQTLEKRLRRVAVLNHPAVIPIVSLQLDDDPPFVVTDWHEPPHPESWQFQAPLSMEEVVGMALLLNDALMNAHRLGITGIGLSPKSLFGTGPWEVLVDGTGLDCGTNSDKFYRPVAVGQTDDDPIADDCFRLGALLCYFLTGSAQSPDEWVSRNRQAISETNVAFARLIREMLNPDADRRPMLEEVSGRLALLRHDGKGATAEFRTPVIGRDKRVGVTLVEPIVIAAHGAAPQRLGRFRLLEKLGQGSMGTVYRGEDISDGSAAAIKLLRTDLMNTPSAIRRFYKEARLLARVNNPFVANLLEINQDGDAHYIATEFVAGKDLGQLVRQNGPMHEQVAVSTMADVARALIDAHNKGIVHRDIKPENIILIHDNDADAASLWSRLGASQKLSIVRPRVKLADFGLARCMDQTESLNITSDGAAVGTPLYMSPEQARGESNVGAPADVYSMGATLFHLVAGRPPFVGGGIPEIIAKHSNEQAPNLKSINPRLSEALCQVVARMLEKAPETRYANAAEVLKDLERLGRGEPTDICVHPHIPECDASRVVSYHWSWDLSASPEALWPLVSNTERFNRAIGLPAVEYSAQSEGPRGVKRFGKFRKLGIIAQWQEHPFEWIEGRRMGILREYNQGVLKWMTSVVELTPRVGGGTRLTQRIRLEPTGWLGRIAAAIEVGYKCRRAADRVYRRIDAALTRNNGTRNLVDAFEPIQHLSRSRRKLLDNLLDQLNHCGLDPDVVLRLGEYLAEAAAQDVARIRPLELARRLQLDSTNMVDACLHGAHIGLLVLLWDILCPRCRVSCSVQETVKAIRSHARCTACDADFELDFANSVEMVFRVHPQIRDAETGAFCIGGPSHSPHCVAQARIAPAERFELALTLTEGSYRIRGPQLAGVIRFQVEAGTHLSRLDILLDEQLDAGAEPVLDTGTQFLVFTNPHPYEKVVRVERAPMQNALTAARATALPLFRALFPGEVLSAGHLLSVATMAFVATDLHDVESLFREKGDVQAVSIIHEHFRRLEEFTRRKGGALIKTIHHGMLAVFYVTSGAVRAAMGMQEHLNLYENTRALKLRIAVHCGPTIAATLNNNIDYFGQTVNEVLHLVHRAGSNEILVTKPVATNPEVSQFLGAYHTELVFETTGSDETSDLIYRIHLPENGTTDRRTQEPVISGHSIGKNSSSK